MHVYVFLKVARFTHFTQCFLNLTMHLTSSVELNTILQHHFKLHVNYIYLQNGYTVF